MKIVAIEKFLPSNRIESIEIDKMLGLKEGYIEKLTGVRSRYQVSANESVAQMGANALQNALNSAKIEIKNIDLLIFTGASFDYPIPNTSTLIKSILADDSLSFPCFDIDSTCLSFLNGLDIANLYLKSGRFNRIAVVSSEISSIGLSQEDEKTFGLFGDAAVAVILENNISVNVSYTKFSNFPSGAMLACLPIGGAKNRGKHEPSDSQEYYFRMEGKKLIRLTTEYLEGFIEEIEQKNGIKIGDFDALITHQTSKYGNEYFLRRFQLADSKVINTLNDYGNCISASIPLGLEKFFNENCQNLEHKKVLLLGAAAGLSLGAMVLEF